MERGPFFTLKDYGRSSVEVKQSEFIGQAKRIRTPEEAEEFISGVRREYPDARHSCYAWILEEGIKMQKYSDDGEPSGTAGMPILSVLTKNNITDAVIVVTRYFGGILLGKGGLVRAYTDAAVQAVKAAGTVKSEQGTVFSLSMNYDISEKMIFAIRSKEWHIDDIRYSDKVEVDVTVRKDEEDAFTDLITDRSSGTVTAQKKGERELLTDIA